MTKEPLRFQNARFVKSCYRLADLPADEGVEVVFMGRSNAGKSTLLNKLCQQNALARVSKTPGRTQCLNIFAFADNMRFVDAPGYGYAKVPQAMMKDWQQTIANYCHHRKSLMRIVLIMDARHPLLAQDKLWIDLLITCGVPVFIVLAKADKLSKNEQKKQQSYVQGYFKALEVVVDVVLISAKNGIGMDALKNCLMQDFLGQNSP